MNPTILRRVQIVLLGVGVVVSVMAVMLVAGSFHNDRQIDADKATTMAEVVSADRLHAAVNFQTPDGQFYSPRLGLLYPTELSQGQRISVDYSTSNPDLARPAGRNASLAVIPALSVAALGWVVVGVLMVALAEINRRLVRRGGGASGGSTDSDPDPDQPDDTTDQELSDTRTA
ncbi:DUF3592 domain-containing protein [Gordonia soli]|nr:DUF3592 domain-containing protein [Gordonia soli]